MLNTAQTVERSPFAARVLVANLAFIIAATMMGVLPEPLQVLVVGLVMFVAPGSAWVDYRRADAPATLFWIVVASLIVSLAAWLVILPFPGETGRIAYLAVIAAITNLGFIAGFRRGWHERTGARHPLLRDVAILCALSFLLTYAGASRFVPALEDQDMETQGTAFGLIHHGVPTMATNRHTLHFFAHPLLLHFWIGESALLSGDLDRLRHYHEGATSVSGRGSAITRQWERNYEQFIADPVLLPTRLPNIFLGAFLLLPLAFLVYVMSGSRAAAILAGAIYMTLPEVYVRTSYGGYMALTNWIVTCGAYFYLKASGCLPARPDTAGTPVDSGSVRGAAVAALLGGWADQKAILLPMATAAHAALRTLLEGGMRLSAAVLRRPFMVAALAIGLAFIAGWGMFAMYGASVSLEDFVRDHIKGHIVERVSMTNINLAGTEEGSWVYPSVVELWRQFFDHIGWPLALVVIAAVARAATRLRQAEGMLLLWMVIGAVGFSLVDWRQTKHLAHLLPPLVILTATFWTSLGARWKGIIGAVLLAGVAWNIWRIGKLMQNFNYIQPTPIW